MQGVFSVTLVLLVALMVTTEANKHKKGPGHKKEGKDGKAGSDCTDIHYGKCVPNSGDCGAGVREATCNGQTQKHDCSIPCNWKKDFRKSSMFDIDCGPDKSEYSTVCAFCVIINIHTIDSCGDFSF